MLQKMIEKGYFSLHDGFDHWEDGVRASVQPLIEAGAVEKEYADSIVRCIEEFGPYIVIAPNIAIPHAQDPPNVHETAVCFMKSNRPVSFSDDPEQDAQLFFAMASNDEELHLQNLKDLMRLLMDEKLVAQLAEITTPQQLLELAKGSTDTI